MRLTCQALGILLFLAGALRAEIRSSADYRIVTDVTDSTGGRSASALYTNDGSSGGVVGSANVSATALSDTGGYIGQLGEVGFVVTNLNDSGPGSLREALALAAAKPGADTVTFDPGLSGQIIRLAGTQLLIGSSVTIDASALPGGITVSGDVTGDGPTADDSRVFEIAAGTVVEIKWLTISGGRTDGNGGGILNTSADLTLTQTTLSGNSADRGGGVSNVGGTLAMNDCQVSDNTSASHGGGVYNTNSGAAVLISRATIDGNTSTTGGGGGVFDQFSVFGVAISHSTLAGNSAVFGAAVFSRDSILGITHSTVSGNTTTGSAGGGVYMQNSETTLTHTTIADNTAVGDSGGGGGLVVANPAGGAGLTLRSSMIAGNRGIPGADIWYFSGPVLSTGVNLIGDNETIDVDFPAGVPNANGDLVGVAALLAPLGDYGGPTRTMALLPGSPAREAASGSANSADQRGYPIVGIPDIGAYEAGTFASFDAWVWESLPAGATAEQHGAGADYDNDEASNHDEWIALTDPADGASNFAPLGTISAGELVFTFPSASGRRYRLRQNDSLEADSWSDAPGQAILTGNGGVLGFTVTATSAQRQFYRVEVAFP